MRKLGFALFVMNLLFWPCPSQAIETVVSGLCGNRLGSNEPVFVQKLVEDPHSVEDNPRVTDYTHHFTILAAAADSRIFFEIESQDYSSGYVVRPISWFGTSYHLYCSPSTLQAYASCWPGYAGNLGALGLSLVIYDGASEVIAKLWGTSQWGVRTELTLEDYVGNRTWTIRLRDDYFYFDLISAEHEWSAGHVSRLRTGDPKLWKATLYNRDLIDERIVKIVSAYIVDRQNDFQFSSQSPS